MELPLLTIGEGSIYVAPNDMDLANQLYQAAHDGDVNTLQSVVNFDPLILTKIYVLSSFSGTPLQLAIEEGHVEFCRILMQQCPQYARLSISDGIPLHLAVAKGRSKIVKHLLTYGHPEDCFKRDAGGRMPIHLAAIQGRDRVLKELLYHDHPRLTGNIGKHHCTRLLRTTVNGYNAIHLCIKYDKLKALRLLVDYSLSENDEMVLKRKDHAGNTLMHLAVIFKRNKIVRYLLHPSALGQEGAYMLNGIGLTPLQILNQSYQHDDFRSMDIKNMLLTAGSRANVSVK